MTMDELLTKLHECRNNCEGSSDGLAQDTFWTLNEVLYDLEKGRLEC
mgnify:FL=1|tara:strand:- start:1199 stop:1339 length:141 start_codon:yes stop_codon:yes gene_type:complete